MPQKSGEGYAELRLESPRGDLSRSSVLDWLIAAKDEDVQWVLSELSRQKPNADSPPGLDRGRSTYEFLAPAVTEGSTEGSAPIDGLPIVQFSSPMYYVEEVEGKIEIDVIRIGDRSGESVVSFRTENDSAIAGDEYAETSGCVIFKPGEATKSFSVAVLPSDIWKTTLDFKVLLTEENLSGAALGQYLYMTRVRRIDNTTFPNDSFKGVGWMEESSLEDVSRLSLLLEFCKLNFTLRGIRIATLKSMLVDLFHISADIFELCMNMYLLDFIITTKRPVTDLLFVHDRQLSLLLLVTIRLVIFLAEYRLDYARISFGISGKSMLHLKGAVLRKFLNYHTHVREKIHAGDVLMAMERDVLNIIVEGYLNLVQLVRLSVNIVSKFLFVILAPKLIEHKHVHFQSIYGLLALPFVLGLFLYLRRHSVKYYLELRHQKQQAVVGNITMTTLNCDLVFGYSLRSLVYNRFEKLAIAYNAANAHCLQIEMNNNYFASWATCLSLALYTYIAGIRVLNGDLAVGMFVTNLKIFQGVGVAFVGMYGTLSSIQTILPSMLRVSQLLNMPTDVGDRKILQRQKRRMTEDHRREIISSNSHTGAALDQLPIWLDLDKFYYTSSSSAVSVQAINFTGKITLGQGQLVAVIGGKACGKATLLRLISGALLPSADHSTKGCSIFVPAQLRLVSVPETPLFFEGTLSENLTFGIAGSHADCRMERIEGICRDVLRMDERVLAYLREDAEHRWVEMFSAAQCKLLMIARALIFNGEVITFHQPLNGLSGEQMGHVLEAFQTQVERKGLLQESNKDKRRPRTVFLSAHLHTAEGVLEGAVDSIVELTPSGIKAKRGRREGGIA